MKEEHGVQAIETNKTWDLVGLVVDKIRIGVKWVYNTILNEKWKIEKHKAMLVAKGFSQQIGIDYGETSTQIIRLDTIRTILAIPT